MKINPKHLTETPSTETPAEEVTEEILEDVNPFDEATEDDVIEDEDLWIDPDYDCFDFDDEDVYVPCEEESPIDLRNPKAIYDYLLENVYRQDKYCKDAAMILFNHIKGRTSRNFVCGPAGCGKTHLWETLKKIYPKIIIVNAANITQDGWKGDNKIWSFAKQIDSQWRGLDYIVVFDEFDKLACPMYSHNENVSASIQSELLKIVEGGTLSFKKNGNDCEYDTSEMTFVFCGSFAIKAQEIADEAGSTGFGFGSERRKVKAYEKELTLQELIDFGVIPELASRSTRITNVRPLDLEDYIYLIKDHPASPIKLIEKQYDMEIEMTEEEMTRIATEAFKSGLGVRNATAQIQRMVDDAIFEQYAQESEPAQEEPSQDQTGKLQIGDISECAPDQE